MTKTVFTAAIGETAEDRNKHLQQLLVGYKKAEAKTGAGQKADAGITVAQWFASGRVAVDHVLMRRLP